MTDALKSIFESEMITEAQKVALNNLIESYDDEKAQLMVPAFKYQILREGYRVLKNDIQILRALVKQHEEGPSPKPKTEYEGLKKMPISNERWLRVVLKHMVDNKGDLIAVEYSGLTLWARKEDIK